MSALWTVKGYDLILQKHCWPYDFLITFSVRTNMPLSSMTQNVIDRKPHPEDDSLLEVKFATTPIMSTYLVAFVIGEYDFVEGQSSDGVTVRVYTPTGKAEQGKFALEVSCFYFF